jgi:shikimate dehydrogenase
MQNAALAALGLDGEWSYEAIDVDPGGFEQRVREMIGEGFVGANVTVPHKGSAMGIADILSETAREIGAANTLSFDDGEIVADNTDGDGLLDALPASPSSGRALVLGAGGAARAVVWALLREGADVDVWNRTELRSQHLCAELGGHPVEEPEQEDYDLLVNSTSVGLSNEDPFAELPMRPDGFRDGQTVVDLVYSGPGRLLEAAQEGGAAVVDGIEILVRQGARSLRIWTGLEPPLEVMRAAARG